MYCPKCGTLNDQRALNCSRCGEAFNPAGSPPEMLQPGVPPQHPPQYPPVMQPYGQEVPNYMTQSILILLFCCMPLGIVGILKANKITKLISQGDYAGALKASNENKTMLWIGFGVGIVITFFYVIAAFNK